MPLSETTVFDLCVTACHEWLDDYGKDGLPSLYEVFMDGTQGCWVSSVIPEAVWQLAFAAGGSPQTVLSGWIKTVCTTPKIQLSIYDNPPSGFLLVAAAWHASSEGNDPAALARQDQIIAAVREGKVEEQPGSREVVTATWYERGGKSSAASILDVEDKQTLVQWKSPKGGIVHSLALLDKAYDSCCKVYDTYSADKLAQMRKQQKERT